MICAQCGHTITERRYDFSVSVIWSNKTGNEIYLHNDCYDKLVEDMIRNEYDAKH